MSLKDKVKFIMNEADRSPVDIANQKGISRDSARGLLNRGISRLEDMVMIAKMCGYKVYMVNEEINAKIEITEDDVK